MAAPAYGPHALARSRTANRIVSGTPVATVVLDPNELRMSMRTTPLSDRTSGPFEPSPGNGPAVSSGISVTHSAVPDEADAAADALAVAPEPVPHATRPRLSPASPMPMRTRRRSMRVSTSKARPWSHAGSVGSGRGRPSKVGTLVLAAADRAVMADSCATPRGARCVQEG